MLKRAILALLQLLIELSLPLAVGISLAYRDYSHLAAADRLAFGWVDDIGKRAFVTSFLLMAFLRIWKARASDQKLSAVDQKIEKVNAMATRLLETLSETTAAISNQIAGGTSKCHIWLTPIESKRQIFISIHANGRDPIIDAQIQIERLLSFEFRSEPNGNSSWGSRRGDTVFSMHFPTLHPGRAETYAIPMSGSNQEMFFLTCVAKNGATEQAILCKRMPEWHGGWGVRLFEIGSTNGVTVGRTYGPEAADWSWTNELQVNTK